MTIDAHVHLWRLSRGDNVALSPTMSAICKDREPPDLKPLLDAAGVAGVVVVQAAETLAETLFIIGLARRYEWIAGVVAWIELASTSVEEEVGALAWNPVVKGVRPVRDDNRSISWMGLDRGFQALLDNAFSLDILVQNWREIPLAALLARRWAALSIVLDHCGKPDIVIGAFNPWAHHIDELASLPNVACKLSGLLNCARPEADAADVGGYMKHVLAAFGPGRVMWASDWPPLDLACDYATWRRISDSALTTLPDFQRYEVTEGTATRVYRLNS
ncbi:MAG TPA: amidohydrolase family protein [Roseiarcus sp.]